MEGLRSLNSQIWGHIGFPAFSAYAIRGNYGHMARESFITFICCISFIILVSLFSHKPTSLYVLVRFKQALSSFFTHLSYGRINYFLNNFLPLLNYFFELVLYGVDHGHLRRLEFQYQPFYNVPKYLYCIQALVIFSLTFCMYITQIY